MVLYSLASAESTDFNNFHFFLFLESFCFIWLMIRGLWNIWNMQECILCLFVCFVFLLSVFFPFIVLLFFGFAIRLNCLCRPKQRISNYVNMSHRWNISMWNATGKKSRAFLVASTTIRTIRLVNFIEPKTKNYFNKNKREETEKKKKKTCKLLMATIDNANRFTHQFSKRYTKWTKKKAKKKIHKNIAKALGME